MPRIDPFERPAEDPDIYWLIADFKGKPRQGTAYRRQGHRFFYYPAEDHADVDDLLRAPPAQIASLRSFLATLRDTERILLQARALENRSLRDIAELLGVHHGTVHRTYKRIVQALCCALKEGDKAANCRDEAAA